MMMLDRTGPPDSLEEPEEAKPELKYKVDLNMVNNFGVQNRRTVTGVEKSQFLLLPPKGCKMNCDFCSQKHLVAPHASLTEEAADSYLAQTEQHLGEEDGVDTLLLFNAGNILWGTEFGEQAGAVHERYWEELPKILGKYSNLKALELEARVDEFSEVVTNPGVQSLGRKEIVCQRILTLNRELRGLGKELRIILPIEYDDISGQTGTVSKGIEPAKNAVEFMHKNAIPWISYAMFGGRLKDQPLAAQRAVDSVRNTVRFSLENGAREVIINCQFLDPINQREEKTSGVRFFVPTKKDLVDLLDKLVNDGTLDLRGRVRISVEKEDLIEGTLGADEIDPEISDEFKSQIDHFNDQEDQKAAAMEIVRRTC